MTDWLLFVCNPWRGVINGTHGEVREVRPESEGLDEPPFDGPLGQRIYDNVSKLAWEQWQEHMKMLLNEYRLQPWKKEHQEFIVQQMEAYFFGEGGEKPKDYVPPSP